MPGSLTAAHVAPVLCSHIFNMKVGGGTLAKRGKRHPWQGWWARMVGIICPAPAVVWAAGGETMCWQPNQTSDHTVPTRVAGLGRLSAGAKMAMKPFVKRVFTIFATNASFLRAISNFRI